MWDVTCELARREQRQAVMDGEAVEWNDYIPLGEPLPPGDDEEQADLAGRRCTIPRGLAIVLRRLSSWLGFGPGWG